MKKLTNAPLIPAVINVCTARSPDGVKHVLATIANQVDPITCQALCPCCQKRCSGEHYNQIHGVEPDDHWGGAKF